MIYFVQAEGGKGPIKIGYARSLECRMDSLQRGSPVQLVALAVMENGLRPEELVLHRRFAEHRLYGEWFAPAEELLACVAQMRKRTPASLLDYKRIPGKPKRGMWNAQAKCHKDSRLPNYLLFGAWAISDDDEAEAA